MLQEVIEQMAIKKDGIYIDGTFGRGGHSLEILKKLGDKGRLIAIDRDETAIDYAKENIKDDRLTMIHSNFSALKHNLQQQSLLGKVDGLLLDLGVSSPQLDNANRGFSFQKSGPLDMRMDQSQGLSVADWLIQASEKEIADVLFQYGEERRSRQISRAIKEAGTIITTEQLVDVITAVMPFNKHKHPATRSFQALRIFINQELKALKDLLADLSEILTLSGKLVVITFHSLEDRIVKQFISKNSKTISYPKGMPIMEKDIEIPPFNNVGRWFAKEEEVSSNRRSRSAILRVCQKNN